MYIEDLLRISSGTETFQKVLMVVLCYAFVISGFIQVSLVYFYYEPAFVCYDGHNGGSSVCGWVGWLISSFVYRV